MPTTLRRLVVQRNNAGTQWRKALLVDSPHTMRLWKAYRKAAKQVATFRRTYNGKKRLEWRLKLAKDTRSGNKKLWDSLKQHKHSLPGVKVNNTVVTSPDEVNTLVHDHFKQLATDDFSYTQPRWPSMTIDYKLEERTNLMEPFTFTEISYTVKNLSNGKAPGPDGVVAELLKHGGEELVESLVLMFNLCRNDCITPEEWSEELMKLIHKSGSFTSLDNYRGISLTSVIGKVFTATLARRMTNSDSEDPWLPYTQAANRTGKNTSDNLLILSTMIDKSKAEGKPLFLGLIDVRKAYDSVRRPLLWQILLARGVPQLFVDVLQALYATTTKRVAWGPNVTMAFAGDKGVKQGDPLSGVLFVHLLAHVSVKLFALAIGVPVGPLVISHLLFADDIVLSANSEQDFTTLLQCLHSTLTSLGLEINTRKSKIIHMGPGATRKEEWQLVDVHNNSIGSIDKVKETKYLGVWLNNRRLGSAHGPHSLSMVKWRVAQAIAQSSQSHDPQRVLSTLWLGTIKPSVLYGADVMPFSSSLCQRLEAQQMRVAKTILGVHSTTSATAVRGVLHWLPLEQEMEIKAMQLWLKVQTTDSSPHLQVLMNVMRTSPEDYTWYTHITALLTKYDLIHQLNLSQNWHIGIRRVVTDVYWNAWRFEMSFRLPQTPYIPGQGLVFDPSLSTTDRALINRLRCGDIWKLMGDTEGLEICPICTEPVPPNTWIEHMLLYCIATKLQHSTTEVLALDTIAAALTGHNTQLLNRVLSAAKRWLRLAKRDLN